MRGSRGPSGILPILKSSDSLAKNGSIREGVGTDPCRRPFAARTVVKHTMKRSRNAANCGQIRALLDDRGGRIRESTERPNGG